jgi:hypothetical protein
MGARGLTAPGVPPLPAWLLYIKGAIFLLSIIILALSAYAISLYNGLLTFYYSSGAPGFLIFLAIYTWIIYGAYTAIELKAQHFYYRIGALVAYVLSVIFWLTGWAWAASWAAQLGSFTGFYGILDTFTSVMGACAGLGALLWILAIVHLVFFILACVREPGAAHSGNVELGHGQKHDEATVQQPYPAQPVYGGQPQQAYTGQPQPAYTGQTQTVPIQH